jgi:hypothetical protein
MQLARFLQLLREHAGLPLLFRLPDGGLIPAHFHITEVGHVTKRFIDCGGTRRTSKTCLLQTWVADDTDHRLTAGKLADIFSRAGDLLPDPDLPVEIEYEDFSVSQFPVIDAELSEGSLLLHLGLKHTDCLAKGFCLPGECTPAPSVHSGCCTPGSGCC